MVFSPVTRIQVRNAMLVQFTWCHISPISSVVVTVGHYIHLMPLCGLAVACSLVKLQQGDSAVTKHYLNFLFCKESNQYFMMKIPSSQSYSFIQLIFAAVRILMLFLIPRPREGQLSDIYSTFCPKNLGLFTWASILWQEAIKPPNCPDRKWF